MENIVKRYIDWKNENPDEGYQYDQIFEFFDDLSRGDQLTLMEWVVDEWSNQ